MKDLIVWTGLWFFVWGILNIYFRWKWEKYKSKKFVPRGLFFLISFFIAYYAFHSITIIYIYKILTGLVIANFVGLFLSFDKKYYKNFTKDRFFILFQTFNILYQQISILIAMILLKKYLGNQYSDIIFGLFFVGIHFPLAFLPWAKLKYLILASCFFGGWLFSYLNFNFYYGIVYSFLIHYFLYILEMYFLKDEEKI